MSMETDLETPWVEKYRPRTFDEIVSQSVAVNNLKQFVESGSMPHMIFTGPAGTGKTSTALIIANHLLKGEDFYRNVLELNASDTVRMNFVRTVLKDFTQQSMLPEDQTIKIVLLDEADNIPNQVQQALRRIIETTSTRVKFILMCNYVDRIIDPIISRCAVFRFVNLSKEKIIERLHYIAKQEQLAIPKAQERAFFETLFFISGGDLRKAINTLQMAVALELLDEKDFNIDEILKISGFVDRNTLSELQKAIQSGDLQGVISIIDTIEYLDCRNFLRQIMREIKKLNLNPRQLNELYTLIGDIDYRVSQGADERIQIIALLADMINKVKSKEEAV